MSKKITALTISGALIFFILLLLWLCLLMSASATVRSFTEPFAGNRRHNIGMFDVSLSQKKVIAYDLESDLDGLEETVKIQELRVSSSMRNIISDILLLKYPFGLYLIEFTNLQLPKELIETSGLNKFTDEAEKNILISGSISVLVLPTKLMRLERINHIETHNQPILLGHEEERKLVKKINFYLPKTIF